MMKRLRNVVALTVPEQRVVLLGVGALLAFVLFTSYRERPRETQPRIQQTDQPSPSPGMRP